jgi:putative PEP-CTERM system histidine kinase
MAVLTSAALAAVVLSRRPRGPLQATFGLGMGAFAAEAVLVLLLVTRGPLYRDGFLYLLQVLGLFIPVVWGFFIITFTATPGVGTPRWPRLAAAGAGALALAIAAGAAVYPPFLPVELAEEFRVAWLTRMGRCGVTAQLVTTAAVLVGLEACLRRSERNTRWRIKYLLVGLIGIFLVRFYFLSHILLLTVLQQTSLTIQVATLFVGNLVITAALLRDRNLRAEVTISRQVLYQSVVLGVLGAYLLSVGFLGSLVRWLGIPDDLFWMSLVVFVSAVVVAAVLLSEDLRWRVKRFIGLHFYRSKYDYRNQWISFTKRLASLVTLEELAPQLLGAVVESVGNSKGALYLVDDADGRLHLYWNLGINHAPATLEPSSPLIRLVTQRRAPVILDVRGGCDHPGPPRPDGQAVPADARIAVPLAWQGALTGLMLIGAERTGAAYTVEDIEFLATVSTQAAGTLVNTRLSETIARSREFDAFHRLTSFLVHDLKNAVAALSMLTHNSLDKFDDPEFQRDAIKTVSKTVERIRALLGKLTSAPEINRFHFVEVELPVLIKPVAEALLADKRTAVTYDLRPVPPVLGDAAALEIVFQNLILNAVDAMDGEGQLTVATRFDNGLVVCMVTDRGCGMSAEFIRQSLFAPFRSTKKGGWGIGLYQAREIVVAHRGRIEVESREGKGTSFSLHFPPLSVAPATMTAVPRKRW